MDPEAAAKKRAARRQEATAAAAFSVAGSDDIPQDLADAEEDDPEVRGGRVDSTLTSGSHSSMSPR